MGIQGLLPKLKSIRRTRHLDEYNGKTVAVDGYAWLHMGVHTCATELALEKPTNKYVDYMMSRVRIMRHHGIVPYIVFDGGPLPAKKGTELEREKKRKEALEKAKKLHEAGKHSEARKSFATCVDVSPQMAYQCIKALKAQGVQYVVAPYEADAQLAYLERTGAVDAILTIDSDLLVFGGKDVLYDLDVHSRTVNSYRRAEFGAVRADGIILAGWSDAQFRTWAIMSGCDYLPNIPGVAIKGAYNALREHKTVENVVRNFRLNGRQVPRDYLAKFNLAEKCFLHQRVYDPDMECLVHFSPVDSAEWNETLDLHVGP
ncbi:PIN domain-like protein [Cylindrobasidium torrendii FP15055 ss-10]|uniref:PIN domain-like protein n=1 Tax=Cylindrobasidium torrendii FP15055 ss-10 TaxID=1314674 RepID=A0A0D7BPF1_9AGAR|nr:PIN domain-like protein [Cylindrobasidium torrendii FP15055 ss-10]